MWFRVAVAFSVQPAFPGYVGATSMPRNFIAGNDASVETIFFRCTQPRRISVELVVVSGGIDAPGLRIADILADLFGQNRVLVCR